MLNAYASQPHYIDHMAPAWGLLERRGLFAVRSPDLVAHAAARGVEASVGRPAGTCVVAGAVDVSAARRAGCRIVRMDHGVGQSYAADPGQARQPSYPGGRGQEAVSLFLAPNEQAAARWRRFYPDTPVVVVGATRVLPAPDGPPCLAVSFHWDGPAPEQRSAWRHYRDALPAIGARLPLVGHAHPRVAAKLGPWYERHGIEFVPDLEEVARRATVYAVDNSSTLYEMAVRRPVIAMNAPWYRRDAHHGLRFWDLVPGPAVDDADGLLRTAAVLLAGEPREVWLHRHAVVGEVIPHLDGAMRAASFLSAWARAQERAAA